MPLPVTPVELNYEAGTLGGRQTEIRRLRLDLADGGGADASPLVAALAHVEQLLEEAVRDLHTCAAQLERLAEAEAAAGEPAPAEART